MSIFNVFTMIGGLAMFLFGMDVMGKSLEKQAGSSLQKILEKLTASPLKGFMLGLVVTAVIQSSSATTVMVVGFVNSGVMQLGQAISVIMGSNVGTTVTSWILSLSGLQGDSFLVQLFKPTTFSPILALIGIILYMSGKSDKKKTTGAILLGFAVLMFGMDTMSGAVKPLANVPEFTKLFTLFTNPILGVIVGAVLTGIIQSSSASVGILQALSVTGAVTYGNAIPIIMGQNIGTCVTALLSSVGANKNAKRAAVVHLYFNIIGVTVFLVLFYSVKAIFKFEFVNESINGFGIAVVHTLFNVVATAIMLPFTKGLEKLACLTVRDSKTEEKDVPLDERLLATPAMAIERCRYLTNQMAENVDMMLSKAMGLTENYDEKEAEFIRKTEEIVDNDEDMLGSYLVKLSSHDMTMRDSHEVSKLLHTIGDFERIGDHAVNLVGTAKEISDKQLAFPEEAIREIHVLQSAIRDIVDLTHKAFLNDDLALASRVEPLEEVVDRLTKKLKHHQIERLREGESTIEMGFILSDLLTNYERVADHCSNIAVAMIEVNQDSFGVHEYLNTMKGENGDAEFRSLYREYKEKYTL